MGKPEKTKLCYSYSGPVSLYHNDGYNGPMHSNKFEAKTMAISAKQAANNIKWQYRQKFGLSARVPINLFGKLTVSN